MKADDEAKKTTTVPALLVGIVLGPVAARLLDTTRWGPGSLGDEEKSAVTLGLMRVMITTQLVGAGYQVRYPYSTPLFPWSVYICHVPRS